MKLTIGNQGEKVYRLQSALRALGIALPQYGVDGIFGEETGQAVKQAQQMFAQEPTGIADVALLKELDLVEKKASSLSPSSGEGVWIIMLLTIGVIGASIHQSRKKDKS